MSIIHRRYAGTLSYGVGDSLLGIRLQELAEVTIKSALMTDGTKDKNSQSDYRPQ